MSQQKSINLIKKALKHYSEGQLEKAWFIAKNDEMLQKNVKKEQWFEFAAKAMTKINKK